jgi:hypothetical protein
MDREGKCACKKMESQTETKMLTKNYKYNKERHCDKFCCKLISLPAPYNSMRLMGVEVADLISSATITEYAANSLLRNPPDLSESVGRMR